MPTQQNSVPNELQIAREQYKKTLLEQKALLEKRFNSNTTKETIAAIPIYTAYFALINMTFPFLIVFPAIPVFIGVAVAIVLVSIFTTIAAHYHQKIEKDHAEMNRIDKEISTIDMKLETQSAQPIASLIDSAEPKMYPQLLFSAKLSAPKTDQAAKHSTIMDIAPPDYTQLS